MFARFLRRLRRHGMMSRLPCRSGALGALGALSRRLLAPGARGFAVPTAQPAAQPAAPRRPRRIGIGELNLPKDPKNEKSKDALGTLDSEVPDLKILTSIWTVISCGSAI